jgi:hypothetical protein
MAKKKNTMTHIKKHFFFETVEKALLAKTFLPLERVSTLA